MEDKEIYVYELQKENQQLKEIIKANILNAEKIVKENNKLEEEKHKLEEEIEKLKNEIISVVLDEKY